MSKIKNTENYAFCYYMDNLKKSGKITSHQNLIIVKNYMSKKTCHVAKRYKNQETQESTSLGLQGLTSSIV